MGVEPCCVRSWRARRCRIDGDGARRCPFPSILPPPPPNPPPSRGRALVCAPHAPDPDRRADHAEGGRRRLPQRTRADRASAQAARQQGRRRCVARPVAGVRGDGVRGRHHSRRAWRFGPRRGRGRGDGRGAGADADPVALSGLWRVVGDGAEGRVGGAADGLAAPDRGGPGDRLAGGGRGRQTCAGADRDGGRTVRQRVPAERGQGVRAGRPCGRRRDRGGPDGERADAVPRRSEDGGRGDRAHRHGRCPQCGAGDADGC